MSLLFCDFLTILCSLGCRLMILGMSPVSRWCRPIYVQVIGVFLSSTGSLLRSWPRSSVYWRLERLCPLDGCDRCCVWFCRFFCIIWFRSSGRCVFILLPLWGLSINCITVCQRRRRMQWVDRFPCSNGSAFCCIFAALACPGLISDVWWGGD